MNPTLPAAVTRIIGQSVLSAYNAYEGLPLNLPNGWTVRRTITGWVGLEAGEELFALVLVPTALNDPRVIIAFRGTKSVADWIEDLYSIVPVPFMPYPGGINPLPAPYVGDGFQDAYVTIGGNRSGMSMQQQLFAALNALPAASNQIIITGHSLGSALAELFMFDYALQHGNGKYPKQTAWMINYAAPRCGDGRWVSQYATFTKPLFAGPWPQTTRIANQYDIVPKIPPNLSHPGVQFDVCFRRNSIIWEPFVGDQHAMVNYNLVINNALPLPGQVWSGYFTEPGNGVSMVSFNPNSSVAAAQQERLDQAAAKHSEELQSIKETDPNAIVPHDAAGNGTQ